MRKQLLCSGGSIFGMAFVLGMAACSSSMGQPGGQAGASGKGGNGGKGGSTTTLPDAGCETSGPSSSYVLIDDMETTSHGPIELAMGITSPLTPGYWYNSGANYFADAGIDMSTPPQMSFVFSALPAATTTLCGKTSAHAARQSCVLNGLYDTCGLGFEFAQMPDGDGGVLAAPAAPVDAGDGGPPIPRTTIPFDISRYKAFTFWGMTTTPDPTSGSLQVKVQLPDTDTDPRGEICNGGGGNTSKCYNSYAKLLNFTTTWQQFTVLLDAGGDSGVPPDGGIAIDPSWGYQAARWLPTQVYGINWQAQRNETPDAGPPLTTDIWVDDVYFIE
ncbi:MAG TPA: hypothetical protein VHO06_22870 [Polyangia bacterium]|nr:hypothetical protein [Polyangia bacterium]